MPGGGAKPGERRGGRRKGARNKINTEVAEQLARLGCNPIEGMATIAMDVTNAPELRGRMFAELAQYVAPKRKAIEVSGTDGSAIQHEHRGTIKLANLTDAQLAAIDEIVSAAEGR